MTYNLEENIIPKPQTPHRAHHIGIPVANVEAEAKGLRSLPQELMP